MSDLVGETQHLHRKTVPFKAVHRVQGSSASGHFPLSEARGFKQLTSSRAYVKVLSDSLKCQVIGPASASVAIHASVAITPSGLDGWPTETSEVLTIGGSCYVQHSVYAPSVPAAIGFSAEAAHLIKPKPQIGSSPEVVYSVEVVGGTAASVTLIVLSGFLDVEGIGFTQTWE